MTAQECVFTAEEKRAALDGVLRGHAFARSDQSKRFLRYICEMEIGGRASEISEYSIGTEALGRPARYTTHDDSSVRSRAYALRQKLHEYYQRENPEAEIRIELRKGSYVPCYVSRAEASMERAGETRESLRSRRARVALGALLLALAAGATGWFAAAPRPVLDPLLREAWGPMLAPGANPVITIASPPVLLLINYPNGAVPPQSGIQPAPSEVSAWYRGFHFVEGGGVFMQSTVNDALLGDALAASAAVRVLSGAGEAVQVLPENGMRPMALRGRNSLLIGSPSYSHLAARLLANMPFSVYYDPGSRQEVIADGPPGAAARRVFRPVSDSSGHLKEVFGLLTVLPGPRGPAGASRVVLCSGITSAGPQAAMEFFASPASLRVLKARLAARGVNSLPPAYQVVVRCLLDGTLALNWTYEADVVVNRPALLE